MKVDGTVWAGAWRHGPGSRHEMFGKLGIECRNFRDPSNQTPFRCSAHTSPRLPGAP
jgi:hypothetical protein